MLPEIAVEALHFLSRRDLDKACGVSKWLVATIAQYCDVYPLRLVSKVEVFVRGIDLMPRVFIDADQNPGAGNSLSSIDDAVHFAGSVLRHSYVTELGFSHNWGTMTLLGAHWKTIFEAILSGAVRRLEFSGVDFSALTDDAFLVAVGCRGLQSLAVERSVVPSGFVTDDLIRASAAKGLLQLELGYQNRSDAPHSLSDEAVLDFFFVANASPGGQSRELVLEPRLRSSSAHPSGSLLFYGAPKQRGLTAFAQYEMPGGQHEMHATYRFPSNSDDSTSYEVELYERFSYGTHMSMSFGVTSRAS